MPVELDEIPTLDGAPAVSSRRLALHVAGHAVIAQAQDVDVLYVTIGDPCPTPPPTRAASWVDARVLVAWPDRWPDAPFARSRLAETLIRIVLAGSVSEECNAYDDAFLAGSTCPRDYELVWSAAALLWNDERNREEYIQTCRQRLKVMMQFVQFHDEVLELASALEECGELYRPDIRAILATVQPDRHVNSISAITRSSSR